MTRYSIKTRDQIFVKTQIFLGFAKTRSKNIGKNISKNLSGIIMEGQQAIHRSKHVYKICAYEVNDNALGKYNTDSQIIFKIATSKSS